MNIEQGGPNARSRAIAQEAADHEANMEAVNAAEITLTFTRRELRLLYAGLRWTPDLAAINASDDEFDAVMDRIGAAAGVDPEIGIQPADDDPKDDDEPDLCECGREPHLCATADGSTEHADR